MNYFLLLIWPIGYAVMLFLIRHDPVSVQTYADTGRLFVPIICLAIIHLHDYIAPTPRPVFILLTCTRLIAVPMMILGLNWLVVFGVTDYRPHWRFGMLELGGILVCLGLFFTHWDMIAKKLGRKRLIGFGNNRTNFNQEAEPGGRGYGSPEAGSPSPHR